MLALVEFASSSVVLGVVELVALGVVELVAAELSSQLPVLQIAAEDRQDSVEAASGRQPGTASRR